MSCWCGDRVSERCCLALFGMKVQQDIIPFVVKISVLRSWRWAKVCPKHVELILEINKTVIVTSSWCSILLYLHWRCTVAHKSSSQFCYLLKAPRAIWELSRTTGIYRCSNIIECVRNFTGRDSSVGIATRYGLDCPGIESRWGGGGRDFPQLSRPVLRPTMGTGFLPWV
jgi:hypothetical protein